MTHAEKKIRDLQIVSLRKQGYSQSELSEMFGLTSVAHICRRYGVDGVMSSRKASPVPIYGRGNQHSKRTEEERKQYVESLLPEGFSYVGGYVDCDHKVTIRCETCGFVFERSMVAIRKGNQTTCESCKNAKKEQAKKEKEARAAEKQITAKITNTGWNEWKQYKIRIPVTSGAVTVGIYLDTAPDCWGNFDDVELVKVD
jgi:hypothetical protein